VNIARINKYHSLTNIKLKPYQLLLDPRNPRIVVDLEDDDDLTDEQLAEENLQKEVFNRINKTEYHIADLIKNIRRSGFISGTASLIVKKIGNDDKYLVLEGNRRTTAVKHLLANQKDLNSDCLATLQTLEAKEFRYVENDEFSEGEVIDVILGKIHINGALSWGAMEKAHYIFKSYQRELDKLEEKKFFIRDEYVRNVQDIYSFTKNEVIRNIRIYRIYNQLRNVGYSVPADRFTLIDLCSASSSLKVDYFEIDDSLQLAESGIERFYQLCLTKDCQVTNPGLFKKFETIYKDGTPEDVLEVEDRSGDIDSILKRVKARQKNTQVLKRLQGILETLETTNLADFSNTKEERHVAAKILYIVTKKLVPLVTEPSQVEDPRPRTIVEANEVEVHQLETLIKKSVTEKPKGTCMEKDTVKLILADLGITTRGKPRQEFEKRVNAKIDQMVSAGILQRYNGKTGARIRILV
jgi:hypothetical protein